jgi:hypothetical protein
VIINGNTFMNSKFTFSLALVCLTVLAHKLCADGQMTAVLPGPMSIGAVLAYKAHTKTVQFGVD